MRPNAFLFAWILLSLAACGAGGGFSGDSGKSSGTKAKPKKTVESPAEGSDDSASDGSGTGPASGSAPPTWAKDTTVECTFDSLESQFHVLMTCTYVHADGTEVKRSELPPDTQLDLNLVDENGAPIGTKVAPEALGLLGFGDFFKQVFVAPVQQVFQAVVQVVQPVVAAVQQVVTTVQNTVQTAVQQVVEVVVAPIVKAVSKVIPGVETLTGLGTCAATAVFPAFCFIKFGLDIKNKIDGGAASTEGPFAVLSQLVKDGIHLYTAIPDALKGQGFTVEGGAFRLFKELAGGSQLFACTTFAGARNFVSADEKCEGQNFVSKLGFLLKEEKPLTLPLFRCHQPTQDDHILSSDKISCLKSGFSDIVQLGFAPLSMYKP